MGASLPPSQRRGKRHAPMAEINVTPLVDVMLVLLIIFMVTAPLLVTGVPVNLPENRAKALDTDDTPTIISLNAQGEVFFNEEPVPEEELVGRIEDLAQTHTGLEAPQIFLRADSALDYGDVMRVMGELNRVGLNKVALVSTAQAAPASNRSD